MNRVWKFLDIPGGAIMGLFTLCMISLSIYVTLTQGKLDAGVCSIYSITVGAFAYSKKSLRKNLKLSLETEDSKE